MNQPQGLVFPQRRIVAVGGLQEGFGRGGTAACGACIRAVGRIGGDGAERMKVSDGEARAVDERKALSP